MGRNFLKVDREQFSLTARNPQDVLWLPPKLLVALDTEAKGTGRD